MADTVSPQFTLNKTDWNKVGKDALWFFLVPLTFYISAVLGVIQQQGHVLKLVDFIPTNTTLIIRKYIA
jgi:hypothetical protein